MEQIISNIPEAPVKYADVEFNEKNEPHSSLFNDVYFSDCGGADETRHVFINGCNIGNRLTEAAANLSGKRDTYVIGETGFGTGLNLLVTMKCHSELREKLSANTSNALIMPRLNFISVEKYPLHIDDMKKAHSHFPQFSEESSILLESLKKKPLHTGLNTLELTPWITVYLLIGDISECYGNLSISQPVDSWYLDGFNPESNTDMWSYDNMKLLVNLSHPGTNLATFTVCRQVKDNLKAAGFTLIKKAGFGRKREMLTGFLD